MPIASVMARYTPHTIKIITQSSIGLHVFYRGKKVQDQTGNTIIIKRKRRIALTPPTQKTKAILKGWGRFLRKEDTPAI
jgi:hypothetical protein